MRELLARLLDWARRDKLDRELQEELQFHQQQLERDAASSRGDEAAVRSGSREARYAAKRQLGNTTNVREAARDRWSIPWMDHLQQDVRYAGRGLVRNPVFTLVVVLTLAAGLGVNAAVFSLLDRLFAGSPAGVANASTLRRLYVSRVDFLGQLSVDDNYNYPEWADIRNAAGSSTIAAYAPDSVRLGAANEGAMVGAAYTDAAYWPAIGVAPALGRTFTNDEARVQIPTRIAVISDALWRRQFHASTAAIGRTIEVSGRPFVVIGVAPKSFIGTEVSATDIWMPLGAMPMDEGEPGKYWFDVRGWRRLHVLLRIHAGQYDAPIATKLSTAFRLGSIAAGYEGDSTAKLMAGSLATALGPMKEGKEAMVSKRLAAVSLLVLIIACANVANLLLTRVLERRREIAVRLALGVSRFRLATQFFTETLTLGALSGVVALLLGAWAGNLLRVLLMPGTFWPEGTLDYRLVAVVGAAVVLVSALMAVVPIVHINRYNATDAMKSGQRIISAGNSMRNALIVAQTALTVVLLVGAGLCLRSLQNVLAVDVGYDVNEVAFTQPQLLGERGGTSNTRTAERTLALTNERDRLLRMPGVQAVALSAQPPIGGLSMVPTRVAGSDSSPKLGGRQPGLRAVSAEYASAVGLKVVSGRFFNEQDATGAPLVMVVNETMAKTAWKGRNVVGECVWLFQGSMPCRTVVGIVQDAHLSRVIESPSMMMYTPLAQSGKAGQAVAPATIIVRASPQRLPEIVGSMTRSLAGALPNTRLKVETLRERMEPQYRPWRLGAVLFSGLGVLGLLVATIGLYGVLAYSVRRRLHEMGIRVALGARATDILRLVAGQGVRLAVSGVLLGTTLAIAGSKWMQPLLFNQAVRDVKVYAVVALTMVAVALVATVVPAAQAARADPNSALRAD